MKAASQTKSEKSLSTGYSCSDCSALLVEAMQLSDGQRLCKSCYESGLSHTECKTLVQGISLVDDEGVILTCRPDRAVRREINNIRYHCDKWKRGCVYVGTSSDCSVHASNDCLYADVQCPNFHLGCEIMVDCSSVDEHVRDSCDHSSLNCIHCCAVQTRGSMQEHWTSLCDRFPVTCKLCSADIPRGELKEHSREACPKVKCTCGEVFNRQEATEGESAGTLLEHLSKPETVLNHLKSHKSDMEEISTELVQSKSMLSTLQSRHCSLLEKVEEFLADRDARYLDFQNKIEALSECTKYLKGRVDGMEAKTHECISTSMNSILVWRVGDLMKKIQADEIITSPSFYTSQEGYKLKMSLHLNGDGIGRDTHISIFLAIAKGEFDDILRWPFMHKVSIILIDTNMRRHVVQSFRPASTDHCFFKPTDGDNIATGFPQFGRRELLHTSSEGSFVQGDAIYLKCIVDKAICKDYNLQNN